MLPTKGHFKDNLCPYYDLIDSYRCARPYCHFKHSKKALQEQVNVSATVIGAASVSTTTPTAAADIRNPKPKQPVALPCLTPNVLVKRKINLEYQPEKPSLDASPSKPRKIATSPPAYVPSTTGNCEHNFDEFNIEAALRNIDECEQELNELSDLIGEQEEIVEEDCVVVKQETELIEISDDDEVIEIKAEKIDPSIVKQEQQLELKNIKAEKNVQNAKPIEIKTEKIIKLECKNEDITKKRHSKEHKSSKSESHHKSSKHSKERDKYKHRERSKDRHVSSRSKDKEKHKSSSKRTDSNKLVKSEKRAAILISDDDFDMRDAEYANGSNNTVEAEEERCLSIFHEIEAKIARELKAEKTTEKNLKRKTQESAETDTGTEDLNPANKKRVAYENADKVRIAPPRSQRPNHIRNAMQSVFQRQEEIRQLKAKETEAAEQALRDAEEKVRLANEQLKKVKEQSEQNLTPLIPVSYLTAPPRTRPAIFPCSSAIALERAKRKVEELKAAKQAMFTPAHSTKGARVAHKPVAVVTPSKDEVSTVNKPPVLEPTSSKISFNLRMQYYDMMVKHCLAMYPNVADAWERVIIKFKGLALNA